MKSKRRFRSLATKFFLLTATLVSWVVVVILAYDLHHGTFDFTKGALLLMIVLLVAAAASRMTIRMLARPLAQLHDGIVSVREGRLEPIAFTPTGDEIEFLAESFNGMIAALSSTQAELRRANELLEERINQRTEQLEHAMRDAMAASQAKSEFLANISHELRTPMNGVLGMMNIALTADLSPEQRDNLETARRSAYALLAVLNDLLDWSKIEAGGMAIERIPFDLGQVLDDCARTHSVVASQKGIRLHAELDPGLPRTAEGDPLRLRQVLSNLLSNAVKFTESGSVCLRVRMRPQPGQDDAHIRLEFAVTDTGIGIPHDKQSKIFDMFTQADSSISRRFGGTGLGLAIARRLVELQGGTLTVDSEPGEGSTFSFALEYGVVRPVAPPLRGLMEPEILVVEDNRTNQKLVTGILSLHGYRTVVAATGREALRALERDEPFHLVLMDVQMPELDGLEATRIIRRNPRWRKLPVVAMTARAMDGDREACLEAGMNAFLTKPIHASNLLSVVQEFAVAARTAA